MSRIFSMTAYELVTSGAMTLLEKRYHEEWKNISRYIRELFNYHCSRCGLYCRVADSRKDLLQVHHIDENPENNNFENLIPLCATCHLKIEKEARLHAPFRNRQSELFSETYWTTMQKMREEGLKKYGGVGKNPKTQLSSEEFELLEVDRELNG